MPKTVIIIGAGPAGLTAAYLLTKQGIAVTVLESDPQYVGGISRTAKYKGFHFDIGGHRFFSKSQEVEDFWSEILPRDLLDRPRSSRIYYRGRFFAYPLKAFEALFKLGVIESVLCVFSYIKVCFLPVKDPKNFEDWVSNQFGKRLFRIFFSTYTEKVWGMSCKDISADWAAQRIKGLSLWRAIVNACLPTRMPKDRTRVIKTLVDSFRYPRKGPGMMWEACAEKIVAQGGKIVMGQAAVELKWDSKNQAWKVGGLKCGETGELEWFEGTDVISSAPLRELASALSPALSAPARDAAGCLRYRDFITVVLILKDKNLFPDNWIYIHDPNVKVGRIQNFKSWSEEMVPNPAYCCYGLEYFCFEGDGLWTASDGELIELAKKELAVIGLGAPSEVLDGHVVRQAKAYPVYDDQYAAHVGVLRAELEAKFPSLHLVGRNGMHKYNNQDHAMMTAMLTVKNIVAGRRRFDVWRVNQDAEYLEEGESLGLRQVPKKISGSGSVKNV